MNSWELQFKAKAQAALDTTDPAHDYLHFQRVVSTAKQLCQLEQGQLEIVVPAAWLHDLVNPPKDSPLRSQASRLSANEAKQFLLSIDYPNQWIEPVGHCIEAHSFSANIPCRSLEAQILQDADRLDALGAIGIARCFATSGRLGSALYSPDDPLCKNRPPNDAEFAVDHFFKKLFKIGATLQTSSAKKMAQERLHTMKSFLTALGTEIQADEATELEQPVVF